MISDKHDRNILIVILMSCLMLIQHSSGFSCDFLVPKTAVP